MNKKHFIPLIAFGVLVALMLFGLHNDPKAIPSPFIGQPAPQFTLPRLAKPNETISTNAMQGKVWLLNIWASWCGPCRLEHPILEKLIHDKKLPAIGLNYKDYGTEEFGTEAASWLQQMGNPYIAVAIDSKGSAGIDWGVVGVPETFVIDKQGIVRYKFTGPVTPQAAAEEIAPLIDTLRKAP